MPEKYPRGIVHFVLRAVLGMGVILLVNYFLGDRNASVSVGLNAISVLTSGTLGIPGVALLYGILFYQIL